MRHMTIRRFGFRSIPIWIVALAFVLTGSLAWASHHGEYMKAAKKWVEG